MKLQCWNKVWNFRVVYSITSFLTKSCFVLRLFATDPLRLPFFFLLSNYGTCPIFSNIIRHNQNMKSLVVTFMQLKWPTLETYKNDHYIIWYQQHTKCISIFCTINWHIWGTSSGRNWVWVVVLDDHDNVENLNLVMQYQFPMDLKLQLLCWGPV